MESIVRWHCVAIGRVQGGNYRARVQESAVRHGVAGSVVNRPDGSVRIVAQGPARTLEAFLEDVRGPRGASHPSSVERVEVVPVSPGLRGFQILRG